MASFNDSEIRSSGQRPVPGARPMKLPQLSLRDLFWLLLVVAVGLGWWIDQDRIRRHEQALAGEREKLRIQVQGLQSLPLRRSQAALEVAEAELASTVEIKQRNPGAVSASELPATNWRWTLPGWTSKWSVCGRGGPCPKSCRCRRARFRSNRPAGPARAGPDTDTRGHTRSQTLPVVALARSDHKIWYVCLQCSVLAL